jgi:adenylate cyclase
LVSGYFDLKDLGHFKLKGVREPVRVHQLRGVGQLRTRFDVARARGLSKFVGRDREMTSLDAALDSALEGQGQVVGVVAEAGTGKSRLCFEFAERCRARGIMVWEARGVAHGKTIPFLLVFELMRGYFGITNQDSDEMARDKIAGRVVRLDPELSEELPIFFEFLGVPDPGRPSPSLSPEAHQRRLFGIIRRLIQARSEREPAVFVFEDLHWIDGSSEAFVENQVESISGTRTLLLVNFRPEYHAEWMQKSYYQQLPLLPLGKEAIQELLRNLLGPDPSLGDLSERIRHRTAGNPFFIEEVVQSLVESGALEGTPGAYRLGRPIDEAAIPRTVQAVLAARIDRLAEREKHVLQTASVIGRTFSESLLARVVELPETERSETLRALLSAEFLYEEALYPEAEYTFKHPLTQEVAYASQLGDRRRRLHAAVARAIEDLHPEQLEERAALLAHHWEEAGEPLEAARWHRNAAVWVGTKDVLETLRHWRRVQALLEGVPESKEALALGVEARGQLIVAAGRLGGSKQEVERLFREARELAERSGDRRALALLKMHYGYFQTLDGRFLAARTALEEARRLIEEPLDPELEMVLLWVSSYLHLMSGSVREALPLIQRALALGESHSGLAAAFIGFGVRPFLLWARGFALAGSGQLEESQRSLEQATALARETHPELLAPVAMVHAVFGDLFGVPAAMLARAREAMQVAEETGFARVFAELALGLALFLNHRTEEAVRVLEEGLAASRESGSYRFSEPFFLLTLARAHLERGDLEQARATAEEAAAHSASRGFLHADVQLVRAQIHMRARGAKAERDVEAALAKAQRFVDESGACSRQPFIHDVRAELADLKGDDAQCERELREAHRLFTEMGATGHAERVARELEQLQTPA